MSFPSFRATLLFVDLFCDTGQLICSKMLVYQTVDMQQDARELEFLEWLKEHKLMPYQAVLEEEGWFSD